jgi:hypothetical protein
MNERQRQHLMLRMLLSENPALAAMVREADEEGIALYGACYVLGVDFLMLTLPDNLMVPTAVYEEMRTMMTRQPSLALNN